MANIFAASGRATDISVAINSAITGDNIIIPDGKYPFHPNANWDTPVIIPAGVNLLAETPPTDLDIKGRPNTCNVILQMLYDDLKYRNPNYPGTWFRMAGTKDPTKPSRFSGIELQGYRYTTDPESPAKHISIDIRNVVNFRVDHSVFHDCEGGMPAGYEPGACCGVIDHSRFVNTKVYVTSDSVDPRETVDYGVSPNRWMARGETYWNGDISQILGQYTDYTIFIEDCYFSKWRHCMSSNGGAHVVWRHNTIEDDPAYASLDAHGSYATDTSPDYVGTRALEAYENEFLTPNPDMSDGGTSLKEVLHIRGGGAVVFNNYIQNHLQFAHLDNDSGNFRANLRKCMSHDIWFWNNIFVPVTLNPYTYDPANIQLDREYSMTTPLVDTNGNYVLPILNSLFQEVPQTDNIRYKPYVYPHPLVGAVPFYRFIVGASPINAGFTLEKL